MTFTVRKGRLKLDVAVHPMGEDLCILLTGGQPHLGAVVLAVPRPSLDDPARRSATASVLAATGHKDDVPAKAVAEAVAAATGHLVTVVCGIHFDGIDKTEILVVMGLVDEAIEKIIRGLPAPAAAQGASL